LFLTKRIRIFNPSLRVARERYLQGDKRQRQ